MEILEDIHFATHGTARAQAFLNEYREVLGETQLLALCCSAQTTQYAVEAVMAYQGARMIGTVFLVPFGVDGVSDPTFHGPLLLPPFQEEGIEDALLVRAVSRLLWRFRTRHFPAQWLASLGIVPRWQTGKDFVFNYPGPHQESWEVAHRVVTAHPELRAFFAPIAEVLRN